MNLSLCFSVLTTNSHKFCLVGNTGRPGGSEMWNIANALSYACILFYIQELVMIMGLMDPTYPHIDLLFVKDFSANHLPELTTDHPQWDLELSILRWGVGSLARMLVWLHYLLFSCVCVSICVCVCVFVCLCLNSMLV